MPDGRVFRAAKQARIRSRNVSTPSALAVASELGVAAGTHLSEDMRPPAPVGRWAAARAGGQPRLTLKIAEQFCGGSAPQPVSSMKCTEQDYRKCQRELMCVAHIIPIFTGWAPPPQPLARQLEAGSSYHLIGAWTASAVRSSRSSILALH